MADLSDVSDTLVKIIAAAFYPDGLGGPRTPEKPVKVYAGWPDPQTLEKDLTGNPDFPVLHISVFPEAMERRTTRYGDEWEEGARPPKTFGAQVVGQTVQITGGQPETYYPQNIGVVVDARGYVVRVLPEWTADRVAYELGLLISADWPGTSTALSTITVPAPARIKAARVGIIGSAQQEVARQEKAFRITIWADSHASRVWAAKKIVPELGAALTYRLPDGTSAYMVCRSNSDFDRAADHVAFRRDLIYTVEYATTRDIKAPELIVGRTELQTPAGDVIGVRDT